MKHSEILQAAKQLLIDKGWTQGNLREITEVMPVPPLTLTQPVSA